MTIKLFILLATSAILVYGNDVERRDNAESYITKEAAKELNKLSARGKQQDLAYDEILEQYLSVHQSGDDGDEERTFEKKYFDYLPNDLDSEDVADEDSTRELLKLENAKVENERRFNSRRFKRDLSAQDRHKRQSIYYVPYPLFQYSPRPNLDFYYPQELSHFPPIQSRYENPVPSNNPWHPHNNAGKFHTPSNFYLPAKPGLNDPQPPDNPTDQVNTDNRVAGFEGEDAGPVWPVYPINEIRRPNMQTTSRPKPPPRPSNPDDDDIGFHNANIPFDIEIPPNIFDEQYQLTTRAPLERPTPSQGKSPNRNERNRQKKPVTTTPPPSKTTRSTTRQPDRTSNSRKQNTTLPACVLAIVNCCSRYDETVRQPCFERFNCNALFFGQKACSADIKASAFREVEKFSQK